jgi:hypothetical protein
MEQTDARGRVVHASLEFAAQVWEEWGTRSDRPAVDLDARLDEAVRDYAIHLGLIDCPNLDEEIPVEVVLAAKSLYAVERLKTDAPYLREHLQRVSLAPGEPPDWLTPEERREGAQAVLRLLDGMLDDDLYVLLDPVPPKRGLSLSMRQVMVAMVAIVALLTVALVINLPHGWPSLSL